MPKIQFRKDRPPVSVFREVGRNRATTFTGLCSAHDHELFKAIEEQPIDLTNSEHLFRLAYRAVLKELHAAVKNGFVTQLTYQKGVEEKLYRGDVPTPPGMAALGFLTSAYMVQEYKTGLDEALLKRSWDTLRHLVIYLAVKPGIALNAFLSTDMYSEVTHTVVYAGLNIMPSEDRTAVVISFREEHERDIRSAFADILDVDGEAQQYELSRLILRKCENFVLSPRLFHAYSMRQIETITKYFDDNVGASFKDSAEKDNRYLFLFSPIQ